MGPKPKYETYEQIRQARNEAQHRYYEKNKERIREKARLRYHANKDKAKDKEQPENGSYWLTSIKKYPTIRVRYSI